MLVVNGIDVFYGSFQVLKKVSFEVSEGETVGLLGPNGHGKTTILKTISGLLKPNRGSIEFDGKKIGGIPPDKIVELGIVHVPQGGKLFPHMTVLENLYLGAYTTNAWKRRGENLETVFQLFPVMEERKSQRCSTLSGGERQMVAMGRGMMSPAKLLMLDEPSFGLAPKIAEELLRKIEDIKETGMSIILVEQNVRYIMQLAERMYLIENGQVPLEGGREEFLNNDYVKKAYLGL